MNIQDEQTEHLLKKLNRVFLRDGYRPVRKREPYFTPLRNHTYTYSMVNCFGHIFNLCNQQFDDYHIKAYPMFGAFPSLGANRSEKAVQRMFDFIREIGLKITPCDPRKPIEDFKSWKIALYFEDTDGHRDFHYLLEEQPQLWSSKIGFEPCVEVLQTIVPPTNYRNLVDDDPILYNLYGTYKITNPHADENNRYVKQREVDSFALKPTAGPQQYVVENARDYSWEKVLENYPA